MDSWWKQEAEDGVFPPFGVTEEFTFHLGEDCRAVWTVFVLQGSSLHCLWLSVPQLCMSACREELLSHYPWCGKRVRVRVGTDLCVRKGTKQERCSQNATAVLLVAWSLDFKGSVPHEMKQWTRPFSYLWGTCLLSLWWAVALETCAFPEQLHPLSWWKALTCGSTSAAVFPFRFSRGVLLPSYILFLSSSINECWRLKFYCLVFKQLFRFLTFRSAF